MGIHDYVWQFLPSAGDKVYGMNDSGWDIFAGTPFKSLAREICQNSLDVRKDHNKPVQVEFSIFELDSKEIPHIDDVKKALNSALNFWKEQQNDFATEEFLKYAIGIIEAEKITCLRISDKNTTGLTGSDKRYRSAWCDLLKGQGVSDKSGTSGGSKGIGKFAPFACSEIRTVFYSTIAEDGLKASQGVSRLISYLSDNEEKLYMGLAYYGDDDERCSPIRDYYSLNPSYNRKDDEYGTDIFIIGFKNDEEWKEKMIGSVLDGFLYAIYNESLVVRIDDITIDNKNLPGIIENLNKEYVPEHADEYYKVLTSEDAVLFDDYEIKNASGQVLGQVQLSAKLNPDFNRTCAMVRQTGMKIMDLNGISSYIYFSAVLYIKGDELNRYLRNLENAQHTEWQVERLKTDKEKREAKNLIKELRGYVFKSIRSLKAQDESKPINLAVGEYLSADIPEDETQKDRGEDINNDISTISITTITRADKSVENGLDNIQDVAIDDPEGDYMNAETGEQMEHTKKHIDPDDERNNGEGSEGYEEAKEDTPEEKRKRIVPVMSSKTRMIGRDFKKGEYTVIFTPKDDSEDAFLDIFMSAESQNYKASIISATTEDGTSLSVDEGKVKGLKFVAGEEIRVNVKLNYSDMCAMEVKGFANKE